MSSRQKELQAREEAATKARQRLERENSQRTDVTHDDADPEEPLELWVFFPIVFLFLSPEKPTKYLWVLMFQASPVDL